MIEWFLAYIECHPHGTDWPSCICLNHPVMLTRDVIKACNYVETIKINCPQDECRYCSVRGSHNRIVRYVELPFKPDISLVHRDIFRRMKLPILYIIYTYDHERLTYDWSFNPLKVPRNYSILYEEPLYPERSIEIDTWKRPEFN